MLKERLAELLSRKLSGEATAAELTELNQWLQDNSGDQYFADILTTYWNSHHDSVFDDPSADQHFAHILEMAAEEAPAENPVIDKKGKIFSIAKISAAAAMLAVAVLAGLFFASHGKKEITGVQAPQNEIIARPGVRTRMVLPDGSQVWLNSDSRLQYKSLPDDTTREVMLEGEAYFDVVKNPSRPFIVHTSSIDIRVLGTAFNVKSYPQENTIETTLIHGLVQVFNKNQPGSPAIILRPKEKLVFNKVEKDGEAQSGDQGLGVPNTVPAISITALPRNVADTSLQETSWVYNRLLFDGDTFRELAVKMERWFDVKIIIKNEKVANYRLRGVFENENIGEALDALKLIAPFNYKINKNEVEITK